jgi:hypothetical protein
VLSGDFGESLRNRVPVLSLIAQKLPVTMQLASMAIVIAFLIGIPAGIVSAVKKGTAWDYGANLFALWGISTPNFCLGIMLIFLFPDIAAWLRASRTGAPASPTAPPSCWARDCRDPHTCAPCCRCWSCAHRPRKGLQRSDLVDAQRAAHHHARRAELGRYGRGDQAIFDPVSAMSMPWNRDYAVRASPDDRTPLHRAEPDRRYRLSFNPRLRA